MPQLKLKSPQARHKRHREKLPSFRIFPLLVGFSITCCAHLKVSFALVGLLDMGKPWTPRSCLLSPNGLSPRVGHGTLPDRSKGEFWETAFCVGGGGTGLQGLAP